VRWASPATCPWRTRGSLWPSASSADSPISLSVAALLLRQGH